MKQLDASGWFTSAAREMKRLWENVVIMDGGDTIVVTIETCGFPAITALMLQVSLIFSRSRKVHKGGVVNQIRRG